MLECCAAGANLLLFEPIYGVAVSVVFLISQTKSTDNELHSSVFVKIRENNEKF